MSVYSVKIAYGNSHEQQYRFECTKWEYIDYLVYVLVSYLYNSL